ADPRPVRGRGRPALRAAPRRRRRAGDPRARARRARDRGDPPRLPRPQPRGGAPDHPLLLLAGPPRRRPPLALHRHPQGPPELVKGKPSSGHDLPKIVAAAVAKVHDRLGTTPVGRLSDALAQPAPGAVDVLRRAKRDFRRSHWQSSDYGDAALQLAGALLPLV